MNKFMVHYKDSPIHQETEYETIVEADSFIVEEGSLVFYENGDAVFAFAPGVWAAVEPVEGEDSL